MSNMSYCRFENTYRDLLDCRHAIEDTSLSESEEYFRKELISICRDIVEEVDNHE